MMIAQAGNGRGITTASHNCSFSPVGTTKSRQSRKDSLKTELAQNIGINVLFWLKKSPD
jgi:hypothetical protein